MQLLGAFRSAVRQFGLRVAQVRPDQWHLPTPCSQWDVTALVDHVVTEELWAPPLLAGRTIADIEAAAGFGCDGGNLGADPVAAWTFASRATLSSVETADLEQLVHLSYGDVPARIWIEQLTFEALVHAWDLARAIGADNEMPNDTTAFVLAGAREHQAVIGRSRLFAPAIPVPGCTDDLTELLALTGRHRWWTKQDGHQ